MTKLRQKLIESINHPEAGEIIDQALFYLLANVEEWLETEHDLWLAGIPENGKKGFWRQMETRQAERLLLSLSERLEQGENIHIDR